MKAEDQEKTEDQRKVEDSKTKSADQSPTKADLKAWVLDKAFEGISHIKDPELRKKLAEQIASAKKDLASPAPEAVKAANEAFNKYLEEQKALRGKAKKEPTLTPQQQEQALKNLQVKRLEKKE